ncbi:MAG: acyl-CoA dehydrogenase family protein [Leptospiraceae bacterium]|nr:acyl-CoA dehydrogenase family protein [Leptospiraceae bacterium]
MIKGNYFENNADLQFTVGHFVDWQTLIPLQEDDFSDAAEFKKTDNKALEFAPANTVECLEGYRAVWSQIGKVCGNEVAPAARSMEKHGIKLVNGKVNFPPDTQRIVDLIANAGMLGTNMSRRNGGLQMALTSSSVVFELMSRADVAFGISASCFNLGEVIERFGDAEMIATWVPQMAQGQVCGAMALTEPNFGSDLSRVTTRAEKDADGNWSLTGTKRFITHACGLNERPSVILTLARSAGAGAKGLSFFLVHSEDIEVTRIEDKMGLHTSPTCEIVFEKSKAQLIGEEGLGLVKYAIQMMNGARMGIAVQSVGIAQAAYEEGKKYASERVQFGMTIENLPPVKRILDDNEAYVHAMRALAYRSCEVVDHYDGLRKKLAKAGHDERAIRKFPEVVTLDKLAKLLTPTAKLFNSEMANFVAYHSLQIFGGSGYTEEFDIARIYRDARITTIYEGTTQLQAVAAIGSIVEGAREGGTLHNYITAEIAKLADDQNRKQLARDFFLFLQLVPRYKDLENKESLAIDIVTGFAYLFCNILLCQQAGIAAKNKHPITDDKSRVAKHFSALSRRYLAGLEAALSIAA